MKHHLKFVCLFVLLCFLVLARAKASSFDLQNFCQEQNEVSQNEFLESFPFQEFVKDRFTSGKRMLEARKSLFENGRDSIADQVLRQATNVYLVESPYDQENFNSYMNKVDLGAELQAFRLQNDPVAMEIFASISHRILGNVSYEYEQILHANPTVFSKNQRIKIQNKLEELGYPVAPPPPSDVEKLSVYVREGHWTHIWNTVYGRYLSDPFILASIILNILLSIWFGVYSITVIRKFQQKLKMRS